MNPIHSLARNAKKRARTLHAYALALTFANPEQQQFMILSGGRRGSHLLIDLLNSHSQLDTDEEILHPIAVSRMAFPDLYMQGLRKRSRRSIYGFRVAVRQLRLFPITTHLCWPCRPLNWITT